MTSSRVTEGRSRPGQPADVGSTQILEQNNCLKHLGVTSGHGVRADGWSLGWRGLEGLGPSLLSWGIQPLLDEPFSLAAPKEWARSHWGIVRAYLKRKEAALA